MQSSHRGMLTEQFGFIGLLVSNGKRKEDGRTVFVAMTPDRKYLTLAVVNPTETEHNFHSNLCEPRLDGQPAL